MTRTPRFGASAGPCERGGGGTHKISRFGHSAAAGSAVSSVPSACLRANRAAAPSGSGPPLTRAGRPRPQGVRARGSAADDDRQRRRRRIQRRMAQRSARRDSAPRSSAAPASTRTLKAAVQDAQNFQELAPAEPLGERLHLRGGDGPARKNGQTWGRIGRRKSPRIACTHPRMRVIHTPMHSGCTHISIPVCTTCP
jgi:hypothetical protein